MTQKYSHQFMAGVFFGLTSGVITALGMIVGLHSATCSRLAVVAGIVIMAFADGLADAAGLHMVEEAEVEQGEAKHTQKEIWLTTLFTFLSVFFVILTFAIPLLIFPLKTAVFLSIGWGMLLLILLNFYLAKIKKESPAKLILEHILLAIFVISISYGIGRLIALWIKDV